MGLKVSRGSWEEESLTPWLPESTLFGWMEAKGHGGGGQGDSGVVGGEVTGAGERALRVGPLGG